MQKDIFIAYSHEDLADAEKIEKHLSSSGLQCFRDVITIPGSAEWIVEIARAIRGCSAVAVLLSEHSVSSEHVKNEIRVAANAGKPLVPILLSRGVPISDALEFLVGRHQYVFAIPSVEAVLPAIVEAAWRATDRAKHPNAYRELDTAQQRGWGNFQREIHFAEDRCGAYLGECEYGSAGVESNAYVMMATPDQWFGTELTALPRLMDGLWEARMNKLEGPSGGWFGFEYGARYPGDYYQFFLNDQGTMRVARHLEGVWTDLAVHHHIRQALRGNSENHLLVVRIGPLFSLFLNGLHAVTVDDWKIRMGKLGLVVGLGVRVAFKDLRVVGTDPSRLFAAAMERWGRLEIKEAREMLSQIVERDPHYKEGNWLSASRLLWEPRPDRRYSVLIVVGGGILAQLYDGVASARLRDEINRRGDISKQKFAVVVTDASLTGEQTFLECPGIAIGGPVSNKLAAQWTDQLPFDSVSDESVKVQHTIEQGGQRVLLKRATASAVSWPSA